MRALSSRVSALLGVVLSGLVSQGALACGVETDCTLVVPTSGGERIYRIDWRDGQTGAFVFAHGYRGSAAGVMRNRALREAVAREGFALVAPEALGTWSLPNGPRPQRFEEAPYFDALVAALVRDHGIDPARIVMSGFSAGGMVTWNLACTRPDLFAGFVPISGTYWKAPPETCPGGVPNIVHIHGTADRTVPLDGRPIGPTVQGKVREALDHMQAKGGHAGDARRTVGRLSCSVRVSADGKVLELCLHPGGHSMPSEFAAVGIAELKARTPLR